ncbi:MAG: hypothetical protein KDD47_26050, partial [Acidobacteria bacterium]|nr:hypothetical protein [Acidobacteriota bacterium]
QNRSLSLTESRNNHPPDGTHTYAIGYQGGHSDADNANHTPSKTVTFTGRTQPGGGGPVNPAGCDLKATFTAPGNTASANGNTTFTVRFDNGGSAQCAEFKVKLMSYNGRSCGGYGTQIGGSRAFRPVGALSPGGSSTVSWTARLGSPGTRCLKLDYSPKAYNDDNNSNHHPQRVVNFQ